MYLQEGVHMTFNDIICNACKKSAVFCRPFCEVKLRLCQSLRIQKGLSHRPRVMYASENSVILMSTFQVFCSNRRLIGALQQHVLWLWSIYLVLHQYLGLKTCKRLRGVVQACTTRKSLKAGNRISKRGKLASPVIRSYFISSFMKIWVPLFRYAPQSLHKDSIVYI